ncbi:MAG TPA: tetratricopeptide repeat protein [Dokdonella sp.]|uniref:tetratricopeptide repeat protein n=1 Tax=Dokdonella sp. TaxID=2291710 RepID=UPI002D7E40BC|nr:tetratricopeptide repeat protein [Dokdonella sp.]HET9031335.1 tetratricopeptide repeat protein [Dokdonella sp.]
MRYQFAEFELDTERELLLGPAGPITLRPQPLRMLQHLIEAAPAVVTRDALMDALWGHHALSINVIPQTLSELRQALGDDAQNPRFIETRHRRGYAFIAPIVRLSPSPAAAPVDADDHQKLRTEASFSPSEPDRRPKPLTHPHHRWMIAAGILLAVGLVGTSALLMRSRGEAGNTTTTAPGTRPIVAITGAPERAAEAALLRLRLRADEDVIVLDPGLVSALGKSTNGPMQIRIATSGAWSLYAGDNTLLQQGDAATGDFASRNNVLTTAVRAALQLSPRTGSKSGWPSDSAALESLANASLALDRDEVERARAGFRLALTDLAAPMSLRLLQARADRRAGDWTSAIALLSNPASDTLGHSTPAHLLLDAQRADLSDANTEAMAALRAYHHLVPEDVGNTIALIDWQLHARQWQAAQATLAELAARAPWIVDVALRVPKARLAIGQEKPDDALALLQPIFDTPDHFPAKTFVVAWQLRSAIDQNRGQSEQSLLALQPYIAIATPDLALLAGTIARERADIALAERAFATAISGFAVQGRHGQQRRAELESAQLDLDRGKTAQAGERMQTLLKAAEKAAEPELLIDINTALGFAYTKAGTLDVARHTLDQAIEIANRTGDPKREAIASLNRGVLLVQLGRLDEAETSFSRSATLFRDGEDPRGETAALSSVAAVAARRGRNRQAREAHAQVLERQRKSGSAIEVGRAVFNLGIVERELGELDAAITHFDEAFAVLIGADAIDFALQVSASRAELELLRGHAERAATALAEVDQFADQGSPMRRAAVLAASARVAEVAGDAAGAVKQYQQARNLREQAGARAWVLATDSLLLRIELRKSPGSDRLRVRLEAIEGEFSRLGEDRDAQFAALIGAETALAAGNKESAESIMDRVREPVLQSGNRAQQLQAEWILAGLANGDERDERLLRLSKIAASEGFGLLAQLAEVTRTKTGSSPGNASIKQLDSANLGGILATPSAAFQ